MLKNTFCHIPGIGLRTEQRYWSAGFHSWDDCSRLGESLHLPFSRKRKETLKGFIDQSITHLEGHDPHYFAERLPSEQHWRLFPDFRGSVAYVDIETTGMGSYRDHITTVALYNGNEVFHYIHGRNLAAFKRDIGDYDVVVTYNGKCFDLPFIQNTLGIRMNQVHLDLRYILKSLGYQGGLKGCEKQLGIDREALDGVDGYFAVLLWDDYKRNGNKKALETLLAYNIMDVVNLEALMVKAYNLKLANTPFSLTHSLPSPASPAVPFEPHGETIHRIRERLLSISREQPF